MILRASAFSIVPVACLAVVAACRPASAPATSDAPVDILVVAPHPDDEVLIAGGVMEHAKKSGKRVAVIVITNGDYTCERDGNVREDETVAALATLGVAEDDVHFLGYPDGHLAHLGATPLAPIERRDANGACVQATGTYGHRGAGHREEHAARTGKSGDYTDVGLEEDLAAVITRLHPADLYVTHALDSHPDHAATYAYVRRALERVTDVSPRIHRAMVHLGACWPNGNGTSEPCPPIVGDLHAPPTPLPTPYDGYAPTEHIAVPERSRKLDAIAAYHSQLGDDPAHDWLVSFGRAEEPFWPETLERDSLDKTRLVRAGATVARATSVRLGPGATKADFEGYTLAIIADGAAAVLSRAGAEQPIRTWPLPIDGMTAAHRFDVRIDPRIAERATELTVRRDGRILGVAIDPAR